MQSRPVRYIVLSVVAIGWVALPATSAYASGELTTASVALSDPQPTDTSNYTFTGSSVDGAQTVRCVQLIWSTTASGTTAPTGFSGASGLVNAGASTLINSSASGWSLAKSDGSGSSGQNNIYQYTNSTGVVPSTTSGATFETDGLANSSVAGTAYFLQLTTYGNTNCSLSLINDATVAFINTSGSTLSITVDPTLTFSVNSVASSVSCDGTTTTAASTSTTIPFGLVTSAQNAVVCQNLQAATNAANGFTVYLRYSGQPTNGTDSIPDVSGSNASPGSFPAAGTSTAYGYSTDATLSSAHGSPTRFISPGQGWAAGTTSNAEIAYSASSTSGSYNVAHQVAIDNTAAAGVYTTTIIYTCTPVY